MENIQRQVGHFGLMQLFWWNLIKVYIWREAFVRQDGTGRQTGRGRVQVQYRNLSSLLRIKNRHRFERVNVLL